MFSIWRSRTPGDSVLECPHLELEVQILKLKEEWNAPFNDNLAGYPDIPNKVGKDVKFSNKQIKMDHTTFKVNNATILILGYMHHLNVVQGYSLLHLVLFSRQIQKTQTRYSAL